MIERRQTTLQATSALAALLALLLLAPAHAELQPTFIRGMALNAATGTAIPNATIATSTGISSATNNGLFYLRVPPNVYDLILKAPGFRSNMANNVFSGPGQMANITIWLAPWTSKLGSIRGRVVRGGSSSGIAGALVVTDTGVMEFTDENGYFSASAPSGTFTITAAAQGYSTGVVKNIELPLFGIRNISIRLFPSPTGLTGPISGTVRDACTGQLLADARLSSSTGNSFVTADGTYRFSAPAGSTSVLACLEGYQCKLETATLGIIPLGAVANFSLVPLNRGIGSVAGTITDNITAEPLEGVRVATDTQDVVFTDAQGMYVLRASTCARQLTMSRVGYQPVTAALSIPIGGTVGFNASLIPLTGCIVSGTVKSFLTAQPVENARLEADSGEAVITNETGAYSLSLASCSSVVSICAQGYFRTRRKISSTTAGTLISRDMYLIRCPACDCASVQMLSPDLTSTTGEHTNAVYDSDH